MAPSTPPPSNSNPLLSKMTLTTQNTPRTALTIFFILLSLTLSRYLPSLPLPSPSQNQTPTQSQNESYQLECKPSNYTTKIVSFSPLVLYLTSFLTPQETTHLLNLSPDFKPSTTTRHGQTALNPHRTSTSAPLPESDPAVQCILSRAREFLGLALAQGRDDIGAPQLVRYAKGQKFDVHRDWFGTRGGRPRRVKKRVEGQVLKGLESERVSFDRFASFFAILEAEGPKSIDNTSDGDNEGNDPSIEKENGEKESVIKGGETYFPHISPAAEQRLEHNPPGHNTWWRYHENGGLAFPPIPGNALFWINLDDEGEGDLRTEHAGLPVVDGAKTAMNIWPRRYFGEEAWDELEEGMGNNEGS